MNSRLSLNSHLKKWMDFEKSQDSQKGWLIGSEKFNIVCFSVVNAYLEHVFAYKKITEKL